MASVSTSNLISCRWDWCRSSFTSIDALDAHVKHEHIWPMKPMRKADVALMRRMDLQSLHSSPNTDSSIISRGLIASLPRSNTPPATPLTSTPQTHKLPENEAFATFAQLSSPPQAHSPQRLPTSPSLESLMKQDGQFKLSAAVEMFQRTHGHKGDQRFRLPSRQHSPMHRPLSVSSGSSQEVVEQHLTQEDDIGSQPLAQLPSELQIENEFADAELRWPTDDELDVVTAEEIQNSVKPMSQQNNRQGTSPDPARGRNFRCGSLNVPLNTNSHRASSHLSQESLSQSQPLVLQTQAPYSSQATGWSQTQ